MAIKVARLEPMGFFLWEYLKGKVYYQLSKNLEELKANIEREGKKEILNSSFLNFKKILKLIISAECGHIEEK